MLGMKLPAGSTLYSKLATLIALLMAALILFPIGRMTFDALLGASGSEHPLVRVLRDPQLPSVLLNSGIIVLAAGGLALLVGFTFAWLNERTDASLGTIGSLLPLVPLILPPVALSVGWIFLAHDRAGLLNAVLRAALARVGVEVTSGPLDIVSWPGLVFVYTMFLVPFVYIAMQGGLRSMDPTLEEASRVSGASVGRTLFRITLPALKPAIVSAWLLIAIFALAVYSIPATLGASSGIRVLSVEIVSLTQSFPSRLGEALVLGLFTLVLIAALWSLQRRVVRRGEHATTGARAQTRIPLGRWRRIAQGLMVAYLLLSSVFPLGGLLFVSLQRFWSPHVDWSQLSLNNYAMVLRSGSETQRALMNSVTLGIVGATLTMLIAFLIVTSSRTDRAGSPLGQSIEAITKIPAAIPHVVMGVAFILVFAGPPLSLHGTRLIILLAFITIYMPQASIVVGTSYDQVGRELVEASSCSGAKPWVTVRRILAPLMRTGLIGGWSLLFILMAGELSTSVLLASQRTPVVGFTFIRIWEQGTFSQLAALACVFAAVAALVVVVAVSRIRTRVSMGMGG